MIDNLSDSANSRLNKHLKGFVLQKGGVYKIKDLKAKEAFKLALQPHKKILSRAFKNESIGGGGGGVTGRTVTHKQRGGFLSFIASALIPVIVELIVNAARKK